MKGYQLVQLTISMQVVDPSKKDPKDVAELKCWHTLVGGDDIKV